MSTEQHLRVINIVPLLESHKTEIETDILNLQQECGITDVAFIMPFMPEEKMASLAKAKRLRVIFLAMREALNSSGVNVGILIQSTMGHGMASESDFTRSVNAKGLITASICPLAPGFKEYIHDSIEIAASAKPDFMLVDDDFRLANYGAPGCYCEHHMAAFAQVIGRRLTREELLSALRSDKLLRKRWDDFRLESLLAIAREIREGIDNTDPKLPCGFCICDAGGMELHFAHRIAAVLAGDNQPFIRVNTAWYWNSDPKSLLNKVYWTSAQMAIMKDIPEILAESDTYPQNRYYTSSKALDTQIIFSILHGCTGLKLWISRTNEYQPENGIAYRKILRENLGLYRELRNIIPHVTWDGPVTPLPTDIADIPDAVNPVRNMNWTCAVMGRMGIPATVGYGSATQVTMLTGPECDLFSDDEIRTLLAHGVLLDGQAALKLCRRGMSSLIGVEADLPNDWKCSFERMNDNVINGLASGKCIAIAALANGTAVRLAPNSPLTQILSTLYWQPFYQSPEEFEAGAGITLFENSLGGRVAVYAAAIGDTPFMDENRRRQLVNVLEWLNSAPLPAVVVSDIDIYAMHGIIDTDIGGGELLALFDLNLDSLDCLKLRLNGKPAILIEKLSSKGVWQPLEWRNVSDDELIVETRIDSVTPLIIRIQR